MDIDPKSILICFAITSFLGGFIFLVYRVLTRNTIYDKSLAMALPILSLITSAIIISIQSSVVISLGMVGALSIVRFRTAIKNSIDLVFLFWAISIGIICGAGLSMIAILLSLFLTIGLLILDKIPVARVPMLLVINSTDIDSEDRVVSHLKKHTHSFKIKSRNLSPDSLDMVIEVRPTDAAALVRDIIDISGISHASLVSHDGEVTF